MLHLVRCVWSVCGTLYTPCCQLRVRDHADALFEFESVTEGATVSVELQQWEAGLSSNQHWTQALAFTCRLN